ncbi:unnamed protein product [Rotaria magnacalcarata]|uniref:UBC core domain-containing protein n=3 Tax=Rotaria magnacalcarata TaxID=392030 RepID=A0A816XS04_9BILA|nr:unnamed protein product [Rotaria magnacalcarata]CAF2150539.1 unnamed protein product [Rotaria magnacalcarata]
MSKSDPNLRAKRAYSNVNQLKNIGPKSNAPFKFILETTPFSDDEDATPPTGDWVITGRVLPNSDLYKTGSIRIQLVVSPNYPFVPPKVYVRSPMYHPNIDKNGEVCIDMLSNKDSWKPQNSFVAIIEEIIKIIDNPATDHVKHPEAASLFDTNKVEYERIAKDLFMKNFLPRD